MRHENSLARMLELRNAKLENRNIRLGILIGQNYGNPGVTKWLYLRRAAVFLQKCGYCLA